jgi:hypothetical protein
LKDGGSCDRSNYVKVAVPILCNIVLVHYKLEREYRTYTVTIPLTFKPAIMAVPTKDVLLVGLGAMGAICAQCLHNHPIYSTHYYNMA